MDEEQKYKIVFDAVTNKFKRDVRSVETDLKKVPDGKRIPIDIDAKNLSKEAQDLFKNFDKLAKKKSKISIFAGIMNNTGKQSTYARLFNDIRSDAVEAFSNMNDILPALNIKVEKDENSIKQLEEEIKALEKTKANAEQRSKKWKAKIEVAKIDPKEIQQRLEAATKGRRQAELDKMATPDWDKVKLEEYNKQIQAYEKEIDKLTKQLNEPPDMSKLEKNFARAKDQIQQTSQEIDKLKAKLESQKNTEAYDKAKVEAIQAEYEAVKKDIETNPIDFKLESESLRKYNKRSLEIKEAWEGVNKEIRKTNLRTKIQGKIITRMFSQVAYWLNPITIFSRTWSKWLDQNIEMKNTFSTIGYNLIRVVAPAMQAIANTLLKIVQYANIFTKAWFKVDLFDKTAKKANEAKKKIDSVTASFDELHDTSKDDKDNDNTLFDIGQMPEINKKWEKGLTKWANEAGKKLGDIISWGLEHPILGTAALLGTLWGTKFLAGLGLSGLKKVGSWIGTKLFGGAAARKGAEAGGSLLGGLFGKSLYTGMNGKVVTVGKLLGGLSLAAVGAAGAITTAVKAGSNWQDLSFGAKIGTQALQGLFSAATGLSAIMLGASGPVGWAIAIGTFAVSAAIGMMQTQDGIASVAKETKKLAKIQEEVAEANNNYLLCMDNLAITMSNLEELERATGLSGKALDEQVKAGKLSIESMTGAQIQVYNAYLQNEEMLKRTKLATEQKIEVEHEEVLQAFKVEAANAVKADSYDALRDSVVNAWEEGSISAEEGAEILSRALANADDETQKVFGRSIPDAMRKCYDPKPFEAGWRKFNNEFKRFLDDPLDYLKKKLDGLKDWWNGLWNKSSSKGSGGGFSSGGGSGGGGGGSGGRSFVPSMAVGTNYVPNDGLIYAHRGEAIIPKKYNKPYQPEGNSELYSTIDNMTNEIASLRTIIQNGIPVSGTFTQRGSDLVAVVDKNKSRRGTQPISNAAYAR